MIVEPSSTNSTMSFVSFALKIPATAFTNSTFGYVACVDTTRSNYELVADQSNLGTFAFVVECETNCANSTQLATFSKANLYTSTTFYESTLQAYQYATPNLNQIATPSNIEAYTLLVVYTFNMTNEFLNLYNLPRPGQTFHYRCFSYFSIANPVLNGAVADLLKLPATGITNLTMDNGSYGFGLFGAFISALTIISMY